jgi:sugar/nucleoside kinase (ribokinase family)
MPAPHVLFAGRTTLDALYWLEALPQEDTKVFARAFRIAPGGPACNAAITHALLGGRATLMSAVGNGPWADLVREELDRRAIRLVDLAAGTQYETPLTTILVNATDATRTIVNPPVAQVEATVLNGAWQPIWGDRPELVLTDGFCLKETLPLLRSLHEAGVALCLDGGSWKTGTDALAPMLTAAICSERFALPGAAADAEATLAWFKSRAVAHVAVTRGPRPILGIDCGRRFELAVERVEAVDTSGAGDVLHGAFCFHFAKTRDFEQSLRRGAEVATRSCQRLGITHWADADQAGPATV